MKVVSGKIEMNTIREGDIENVEGQRENDEANIMYWELEDGQIDWKISRSVYVSVAHKIVENWCDLLLRWSERKERATNADYDMAIDWPVWTISHYLHQKSVNYDQNALIYRK